MPAPNLTTEQSARVDSGLCACGCGGELAAGRVTIGTSCRSRAYRQRRKAGAVLSKEQRARIKKIEAITEREQNALRDQETALRTLRYAAEALARAGRERAALLAGESPVGVLHGLSMALDYCLAPCVDCDGTGKPMERESASAKRARRQRGELAPRCLKCKGTGVTQSAGLDEARRWMWSPGHRWSSWGSSPLAVTIGGHSSDAVMDCPGCARLVRVHDGRITPHGMGGRLHEDARCKASGAPECLEVA